MVTRCKHGLIPQHCGVCRREAARAEAIKAQLAQSQTKKSEMKGTSE